MGIDPGLATTGWGIIQNEARARYLDSGVIRTSAATEHVARLNNIYCEINNIIVRWQPQAACIERVFANMNGKSSMALGEARGAAIAALCGHNVRIMEISALQIKKSITGMGRADKKQVAKMIPLLLADAPEVRADAADALACALTMIPLANIPHSRMPPIRSRRRISRRR